MSGKKKKVRAETNILKKKATFFTGDFISSNKLGKKKRINKHISLSQDLIANVIHLLRTLSNIFVPVAKTCN